MPIDLREYKEKRGRLETLDLGDGDVLSFRWHPDRLTDDALEAIRAATDGETRNAFTVGASIIVPLVSWWDITQDGTPYPITEESVGQLGLPLCMAITTVISRGINEDETKKDSGGG